MTLDILSPPKSGVNSRVGFAQGFKVSGFRLPVASYRLPVTGSTWLNVVQRSSMWFRWAEPIGIQGCGMSTINVVGCMARELDSWKRGRGRNRSIEKREQQVMTCCSLCDCRGAERLGSGLEFQPAHSPSHYPQIKITGEVVACWHPKPWGGSSRLGCPPFGPLARSEPPQVQHGKSWTDAAPRPGRSGLWRAEP